MNAKARQVWTVTYNLRVVLHFHHAGVFAPDRNGDRVTGQVSRGYKLLNVILEKSRWLDLLHENILQAGKQSCYAAPNKRSKGGRDTWRKLLG